LVPSPFSLHPFKMTSPFHLPQNIGVFGEGLWGGGGVPHVFITCLFAGLVMTLLPHLFFPGVFRGTVCRDTDLLFNLLPYRPPVTRDLISLSFSLLIPFFFCLISDRRKSFVWPFIPIPFSDVKDYLVDPHPSFFSTPLSPFFW